MLTQWFQELSFLALFRTQTRPWHKRPLAIELIPEIEQMKCMIYIKTNSQILNVCNRISIYKTRRFQRRFR